MERTDDRISQQLIHESLKIADGQNESGWYWKATNESGELVTLWVTNADDEFDNIEEMESFGRDSGECGCCGATLDSVDRECGICFDCSLDLDD